MKNNNRFFGNLILFVTAIIWGSSFVSQREAATVSTPPLTFGAARTLLAAAILWIVALAIDLAKKSNVITSDIPGGTGALDPSSVNLEGVEEEYRQDEAKGGIRRLFRASTRAAYRIANTKGQQKTDKKTLFTGGLMCGLCLFGGTTLQQFGIAGTTAGKAGFLTAIYTVLVPFFAFFIFKQKIGAKVWLGAGIALGGLYLLSIKGDFSINPSDILIMLCAICFAFQILCIDRFVDKVEAVKLSAMQFTVSSALSWVLAFLFESPSMSVITPVIGQIIYVGIFSGAIGYTLQMVGQKLTDPTTGALIMSLESVFSVLSGALILHEVMSTREIVGSILMFAAVIIVQLPSKKRA